MCGIQAGMILQHTLLVVEHTCEKPSVSAAERQVGEQINAAGNHHEKPMQNKIVFWYTEQSDLGSPCGKYRLWCRGGQPLHRDIRGSGGTVCRKQHRKSGSRVHTRPFAGDAKAHGNAADSKRDQGSAKRGVVKLV